MKKILGLDLGTNSIGWAVVNEAESDNEKSSIVRLGVRVNPLTVDESLNFEKGKPITTNASRTLKRSMRRNLQRYKLRRENLIELLKEHGFIDDETVLAEQGNRSTFETWHLRSRAASEEITLTELARVLLMINKKRGYKSSRKAKSEDEGTLIDGMEVAKHLYNEQLTPGQYCLQRLTDGARYLPDFYRSDLREEFLKVWNKQKGFYPDKLTDELYDALQGRNKSQTWAIIAAHFDGDIKGFKREVKGAELRRQNYQWRVDALTSCLAPEQLAVVLQEINGQIAGSSGYLGAIGDRSKELYFNRQTVGQYQMSILAGNPNASLRNMVFYRQDYMDEFDTIWECQAKYHPELTPELKHEVRDIVIFYQRKLKSKKGEIAFCEFESHTQEIVEDGKKRIRTIGSRVIPRSSPLFQEFKIWQTLNNIEVTILHKGQRDEKRDLLPEEKELLASELSLRDKMSRADVLKHLFGKSRGYELNYKELDGDRTGAALYQAFSSMLELSGHAPLDFSLPASAIRQQTVEVFRALGWNTGILSFDSTQPLDSQPYYNLWHLLYSFEGDDSLSGIATLVQKLQERYALPKDAATVLANVTFLEDYGSLSARAIHKILPFLREGNTYDVACAYAGYRHSAASLTREELDIKELKDHLDILPRGALRNPVVEKILNQMINVVNAVMDAYGQPDEIRIELARELKKNAKERAQLTQSLAENTKVTDACRKVLETEFGFTHVSRNDIIRYRLYEELKDNGYRTLYSNTYIPREKLFSKDFDIEHIIPQSRLFDDSLSNKTLELKSINIEKGNRTAYDFVKEKYGDEELERYVARCEAIYGDRKGKLNKLKIRECEIPEGFIERDLRNTQYIARKACEMLSTITRRVVATTGSITDELRNDWQLVDVMKELNWPKYEAIGQTTYFTDHNGRRIGQINDWSKRNDHRHHAMDALTIAFTREVFVQYYNNKNASFTENSNEYFIRNKYFHAGCAIPPMPLDEFRAEAKRQLEAALVSIKAKNKVCTTNINRSKGRDGSINKRVQQTPRGQLHEAKVRKIQKVYVTREESVNGSFDEAKIATVASKVYRTALMQRFMANGSDAKKAFTGKNSLVKNPIWLDEAFSHCVPAKVKTVTLESVFTKREEVTPKLNIEDVVDVGVKRILQERLKHYDGNASLAFSNLDQNPIWFNQAKGIAIKRVFIRENIDGLPLHTKHDHQGKPIVDVNGNEIPTDYVRTGNNHHVAIYRKPLLAKDGQLQYDKQGNIVCEITEEIVSFFEVATRVNMGLPVIDKNYRSNEGWQFLYSMKQNEYFVIPDDSSGFDPMAIDLLDPNNYALISPHLFRVQKFSYKNYMFRHHLETSITNTDKSLRGTTWLDFRSSKGLDKIVKVRVNHIGQIVAVGEY